VGGTNQPLRAKEKSNMPPLAAQVYTIRNYIKTPDGFARSMEKVRAMGYAGVQLDLEHHPDVPATHIKRCADDMGLQICITHFDYELFFGDLEGILERQAIWDCGHTAIVAMPARYRQEGVAGYRRFAAEASEIGARLAEHKITLSYHNHSFEFQRFGRRTGLDILFEESVPAYFQAEIDTYWVQHGGADPAAWIRRMAGRMPVVHLKDMVILPDGSQAFAEVGEGNLNWPSILAACQVADPEWAVVEQDVCRIDPFESLRLSHDYLVTQGFVA
jgi:sugar phosphate isomerase/epimerase